MADIEIKIDFSYRGGEDIFSALYLSAEKGEHILFLSPPGSGKTTLAKILTGSIPKYIDGKLDGHFIVDGKDVFPMDIPERMEIVGRVSQNTDEMLLFSSVEEELSFPLDNLGLDDEEKEARIRQSLSLFGLERYRNVSTSELSGGEKRRLMLSVLFAVNPDIYILDEAFDELSPEWRERLAEIIRGLDRTVIVLASHLLKEYEGLFHQTLTIEDQTVRSYDPEPFIFPPFTASMGTSRLVASKIVIERDHRSSGEIPSFQLSVPQFELQEGECVTLVGDNGCGKSSFSRVLTGLLKERSGDISIDGRMLSARERRSRIAYLMQNPYEELFLPTVREEALSTKATHRMISNVLDMFGLDPESYVQELSYGKAKMLQAAVFYLLERPFVIFDEMDSAVSSADFALAVSAFLERGSGLLVITHDMLVASALPGRKLRISGGVLYEC